MNKTIRLLSFFMPVIVLCFICSGCGKTSKEAELWDSAIYKENVEFGKGKKTIIVEMKVYENSTEFKINTDKDTLGDALSEYNLISGEKDSYGMYVKTVNGITADYNIDKSYWSFSKDGEYLLTGVDSTEISDGEHYEIVYTKQ